MRVLLSSVGTRGDVQPIVAVAVALRRLGHEARLCVPPNLVAWVAGYGFEAVAVGVEMRAPTRDAPPLTAEELQRLAASMPDLITDQFEKIGAAADGCAVILGANAHQYAARSIAERRGVPYVTALYAPVAIPSPEHAPPPAPGATWTIGDPAENVIRWTDAKRAWNARALDRVNANRARLGLAAIDDVLDLNVTRHPWLATDAQLAPAPSGDVFQTGAWILDTPGLPLAPDVAAFLDAGEAPIYFGLGSMPVPAGVGATFIAAARSVNRRAIVSRGWGELDVATAGDVIAIDEVDQRVLFPRVAAIVHHGGAGTTAAAARSGTPQVIAPMFSDQFYFASRVRAVGIGTSVARPLAVEPLASGLTEVLADRVVERARQFGVELPSDGALVAARRLIGLK